MDDVARPGTSCRRTTRSEPLVAGRAERAKRTLSRPYVSLWILALQAQAEIKLDQARRSRMRSTSGLS